jgi:hypothetical protein
MDAPDAEILCWNATLFSNLQSGDGGPESKFPDCRVVESSIKSDFKDATVQTRLSDVAFRRNSGNSI